MRRFPLFAVLVLWGAGCADVPTSPESTSAELPPTVLAAITGCDEVDGDCAGTTPCPPGGCTTPCLPPIGIGSPPGPGVCDDDPPPATFQLTEGKVTGHGVYSVDGRSLSFSFHGMSDGAEIKGNFEFHDRPRGPRWHGEITCLQQEGERLFLEGVVSQARGGGPAVGDVVAWVAVDRGEGRRAPRDGVSDPEVTGPGGAAPGGAAPCGLLPVNDPVDIGGGNIQMH